MQRLLVIFNPNSSQYVHIKDEFLSKLPNLKGVIIGKFAIKKAPFEENLKNLKKILKDGDLVISAGGDATASVAVNAILESKKDVTLAVLPYGNFNDLARTLGLMSAKEILDIVKKDPHSTLYYPLEIWTDGKFYRYAPCYVTIGMVAEACELFDEPKFRKDMKKGHKSSWRSYLALAKWYFKNRRKKTYLPPFTLNGKPVAKNTSDYCALNSRSMCRVMKGGSDYLRPDVFRSISLKLTSFPRLFKLMSTAILSRTPGYETTGDKIEFINPATVELQAEGEYKMFKDVRTIEIRKGDKCLKVIHG